MSSLRAGAEMMTFLRAGVDVGLGLRGVGEQAGRLDDDLGAQLLPRDVARVALGGDLDLAAVDDERLFARLDLAGVDAVVAVVLEQVGVGRGVEQVVDADDLDVVGWRSSSALSTWRPMRPKPLMPTRTAMRLPSLPVMFGTRPRPA